jgi:hypothetical protein
MKTFVGSWLLNLGNGVGGGSSQLCNVTNLCVFSNYVPLGRGVTMGCSLIRRIWARLGCSLDMEAVRGLANTTGAVAKFTFLINEPTVGVARS